MAHRAVTYDQVRNVSPVADSWVIRVLLSRMWCVHDEFENKDCIAVDMLLIDSDGCKIQAKVYKMLFNNFLSDMLEGSVYVIKNFSVVPNNGKNKATNHPFFIIFQRKTVVTRSDPDVLHSVGLSPLTTSAIQELQYTDEYLVGVSTEKEYVSTGVVHRFITLELTDHTGKVEMAIFDEYVDKFIEYLAKFAHLRPVVVVQLAASGPVNGVLFGMYIMFLSHC
ncbi:Nucleic acid-binding, OB-fold [Sesbania bispinosa]|nr:Nucleic acid-binding, OB-fold [Sesbania bispinosa]